MKIKNIICFICLIIFTVLAYLVMSGNNIAIDSSVYNFISKFISNNLTTIFKIITFMGSGVVVIIITLFIFILFKNKKYGLYLSINLISITLIQYLLKNIFTRNRPVDINLIEENGYSFPSGHSLTAVAFYGLIIYFIYKSNLSKKTKNIIITLLTILIILIGLSRIYLGVHYITDVLGGFTIGILYVILFIDIVHKKVE